MIEGLLIIPLIFLAHYLFELGFWLVFTAIPKAWRWLDSDHLN